MEEDETVDIKLPKWVQFLAIFLIGIGMGVATTFYQNANTKYRSPSELADYMEEMLFEEGHREDIKHHLLIRLMDNDKTTLADIKQWYSITKNSGARSLLEMQLNDVCYKRVWKDESKN